MTVYSQEQLLRSALRNPQIPAHYFSDMLVRPDSLKELKDQLEHAEVPGAFTGKSSMNIWKRNDPETYRWFMDHYELKETIPFYGEKFLYYIKK